MSRIDVLSQGSLVPFFRQPDLNSAEHPWAGYSFEESVSDGTPLGSHAWGKTTLLLVRGGQSSLQWKHRGVWNTEHCKKDTVSIIKRDVEIQEAIPSARVPMLILQLDRLILQKIAPDYFLTIETSLPTVRVVEDHRIGSLLSIMADEVRSGCSSGRLYGEAVSIAVLAYIAANYTLRRHADKSDYSLTPSQMRHIIEYIQSNLTQNICVTDMAAQITLSPSHFSRVFKRAFGVTPYRFVMHQRIEKAKSMLTCDGMSSTQIATSLGFANHSHFSRVFRQFAGVAPKQFRTGL